MTNQNGHCWLDYIRSWICLSENNRILIRCFSAVEVLLSFGCSLSLSESFIRVKPFWFHISTISCRVVYYCCRLKGFDCTALCFMSLSSVFLLSLGIWMRFFPIFFCIIFNWILLMEFSFILVERKFCYHQIVLSEFLF